jgi:sulfur carrier protein
MNTKADTAGRLTLRINGQPERLATATIAALLASRDLAPDARGIAIALNGRVVPRDAWTTTALHEGDSVEIVRAMQGG